MRTITNNIGGSSSVVRNSHIDRLRALCVFLVVNMHYAFIQIPYPWIFGDAGHFKRNGFYGVTMFFVISGFLITSVALNRWKRLSNISINDFYIMRAARILPAVTGLTIFLIILHTAGLDNFAIPPEIAISNAVWHVFTFRYNYLLGANNVPGMYSWSVLWSLSVEELFYLCFPVLCLALRTPKLITGALVLFVFTAPYGRSLYGNYTLVGSADSISLGCLAAM